jgi:lantibiotic modifying enzyme
MCKGIIYNEFGEIADRFTSDSMTAILDWFDVKGVLGNVEYGGGDVYYFHRKAVG